MKSVFLKLRINIWEEFTYKKIYYFLLFISSFTKSISLRKVKIRVNKNHENFEATYHLCVSSIILLWMKCKNRVYTLSWQLLPVLNYSSQDVFFFSICLLIATVVFLVGVGCTCSSYDLQYLRQIWFYELMTLVVIDRLGAFVHLEQVSANFFLKHSESKDFRLCRQKVSVETTLPL